MFENLLKMASEQSFSIALLLTIAFILWKTMQRELHKKDERIADLEKQFRDCIQKNQIDNTHMLMDQQRKYEQLMTTQNEMMAKNTEALEHNSRVIGALTPLAKNFRL